LIQIIEPPVLMADLVKSPTQIREDPFFLKNGHLPFGNGGVHNVSPAAV